MSLTPEQLAMRFNGIGGSEVAIILGLNPYRGPEDLRLEKLGLTPPFMGNSHTERGTHLEDGMSRWWAERNGGLVMRTSGTLQHPTLPHVFATPDRLVETPEGIICLQIKVPGYFSGKKWLAEGAPAQYVAQVVYEMGVAAANGHKIVAGKIAALICDDLRDFHVPYEPEMAESIMRRANAWFVENVVAGRQPQELAS